MRILVSIPAFGMQVYYPCISSLISCMMFAKEEGLDLEIQPYFLSDSLIHRARNRAALYAVEHKFDKILTIDADIVFTYEDFKRLVLSDKDVIGGVYPLKAFPVCLNFNPLPEKGTELLSTNRGYDYDAFLKFKKKYADEFGLAEVQHLATGFLCVTRRVFEKLGETSEIYEDLDSVNGERKRFMHFYTSGVHGGILESEDWSMCRRAREAGFSIYFDTRVLLGHIGLHCYRIGQFFGETELMNG